MVARILFQPLEESSRLFYSQNLGTTIQPINPTSNNASEDNTIDREKYDEKLDASLCLLKRLLKLQIYLGLVFTCFCPHYTTPLLYHLLGGSRWLKTNAPSLLQSYLYLLPFLGINGILEAFVQAVANDRQLGRMSYALVIWSGLYCATCFIAVTMLGWKEHALILANAISMLGRIGYSARFIGDFFAERGRNSGLFTVIKRAKIPILASMMASTVMRWSARRFIWHTITGFGQHVLVGGLCFAACLAVT